MRIVITSNYELGNETGSAKVTRRTCRKSFHKKTKFYSFVLVQNSEYMKKTKI